MSTTAGNLLQNAAQSGILSGPSLASLQAIDLGKNIQNALGTSPDDIEAAETTIIAILIDDSGSITFARDKQTGAYRDNSKLIIDGQNMMLDALAKSKTRDGILISTRYMNGNLLHPFVQLDQAVRMNSSNYTANGGTPLYDMTAQILADTVAKVQEFADQGIPSRGIVVIVTDGADVHSRNFTAGKVAQIVGDLLASENFIISAMGIDDGSTDFQDIFKKMGLPEKWVLTPGNTEKDIRAAWAQMSQSAAQASQNAGSFSKTAIGGFGN